MLIISTNLTAQVDPGTTNLTHSWTFDDGTANDYVGHTSGKLVGGASISGGALVTSAQGQWMEMPGDSIALNSYTAVSLEAWYTPAKNSNPNFTMLAFFGNTQNAIGVNYYFMTAARVDSVSRTAISCNNLSTPWSAETGVNGPEFDDGRLHHMVSTLTSDSIKLYIDGNLTSASKLDTNNAISRISRAFAYLAKSGYNGDLQWLGRINEFNIYNKALNLSEVSFLFKKGLPGTENLTHSWTFDDSTANDYVGHLSGKLMGGASIYSGALVTSAQGQWMEMPADSIALNKYSSASLEAWYTPTKDANPNFTMLAFFGNTQNSIGVNYYFMTAARLDSVSRTAISCDNLSTPWSAETGVNGPEFDDGNLHHIVSTLSSDSIKLYIDGNLTGAGKLDTNNNISRISQAFAYLAKSGYTGDLQWLGQIHEFNIYNKALNSAEVNFLFKKGVYVQGGAPPPPDTVNIWQGPALAAGQGKFLGNADDNPAKIYSKYWTQITPGNAGKWGSVAGVQDTTQWNWNPLNTVYNYAQNNHLIFKDHNLIWGQQQPSWISALDSATQYKYIEAWIRMVGQRYPKTDMIDVVNEPLNGHNPPDGGGIPARANYKKALGGNGVTGWDWVINAFTLARKYLPHTKLLINDYGIINDNAATVSYIQIINLLKARNLIDGIGVQGHRFELESADTSAVRKNLDKLAATGIPVYISEFDLGNFNDSGTPNDNTQLQLYQKVFPVLWKHPGVYGITLWGYIQNQMWQVSCYLINSDYTSRPAFNWLASFVKDNPMTGVTQDENAKLPSSYELKQNYPNPFNPTTNIQYNIPKTSIVSLRIYDVLGRLVQTLVNTEQKPGSYSVSFNAQNLSSGVYFYQINAGSFTQTKKLLLLK
jgi:GH35 family endo-1,4-beta-xylanase